MPSALSNQNTILNGANIHSAGLVQPLPSGRPLQIIRRDEVLFRCGFKKSTLYAAMAEGRFPKAVHLGPRAVGWLAHEVDEWIAGRIAESRPDHRSQATEVSG